MTEMIDRLIELLKSDLPHFINDVAFWGNEHIGELADHLIANGVILPPCKVGDTLWVVWSYTKSSPKGVYPVKVYALRYDNKENNMRVCVKGDFKMDKYDGYYDHHYRGTFSWKNVGKTVFLTREEAEKECEGK